MKKIILLIVVANSLCFNASAVENIIKLDCYDKDGTSVMYYENIPSKYDVLASLSCLNCLDEGGQCYVKRDVGEPYKSSKDSMGGVYED